MNSLQKIALCLLSAAIGCEGRANDVPEPQPFLPVPTQAQLNWHKAEYIMFAHFGMKTFYPGGGHMGNGKEDPKRFDPAKFDARQWVAAAKAGGFKGIVLTAKHHDGFCNWQTETTDHCVKSATWNEGKGDVVRDLIRACRQGGLYFGVYVSIIDKRHEQAGSAKHATYGEYYYDQIKELSTKYGPLDEYWFDGFNATKLKLDYQQFAELIRTAQPKAVVYDSGTMVKYIPDRCLNWPGNHGGVGPDQNYCRSIDGVMRWYPSEPSIILQGNWFHNGQPAVSLQRMQDYYLTSVGYGVTPLMNVAPNADGLIDEATVEQLKEFKAWVDQLHKNDLARSGKVKVSADSVRGNAAKYAPEKLIDGDYETYYATDDVVKDAVIEIDLGRVHKVNGFIIQEYIPLGQRVDGYSIECRLDGKWVTVFSGKKIGYKRIILEGRASASKLRFPETDHVRLKIEKALACPLISTFQVIGTGA